MPVIFIGHGNPMNAVRDTPFTRKLGELGKRLPRPKAVLCISAHWMTEGTWVTHMSRPKTIHEFYGFPQELFEVHYPAPGDPATAERISQESSNPSIHPDNELWGLDHGTWSVLRHMYPAADVPVLQLSLNIIQGPEFHFALGEKLKYLRDQGILIVGSGNIVHNLGVLKRSGDRSPYDWAQRFNDEMRRAILDEEPERAIDFARMGLDAALAAPSPEHFWPLLYVLGARGADDRPRLFNDRIEHASLAMTSFVFEAR